MSLELFVLDSFFRQQSQCARRQHATHLRALGSLILPHVSYPRGRFLPIQIPSVVHAKSKGPPQCDLLNSK